MTFESDHMHNDLQFETDIKGFTVSEQFLARQVRSVIFELVPVNRRLENIEKECKVRSERCRVYIQSNGNDEDIPNISKPNRRLSNKQYAIGGATGVGVSTTIYFIAKAILSHYGIDI
jgi:hypothetical protein